jgi:hypothetical protein
MMDLWDGIVEFATDFFDFVQFLCVFALLIFFGLFILSCFSA